MRKVGGRTAHQLEGQILKMLFLLFNQLSEVGLACRFVCWLRRVLLTPCIDVRAFMMMAIDCGL
jgi:hypothetical protein